MDDLFGGIGAFISLIFELLKTPIGAVAFLVAIVIGTSITLYMRPVSVTEGVVEQVAKDACKKEADKRLEPSQDYWERDIDLARIEDENGSRFCVATSAGRDGEFGSDDDISHHAADLNKSRLLGKWAKVKGKEFLKGLLADTETQE